MRQRPSGVHLRLTRSTPLTKDIDLEKQVMTRAIRMKEQYCKELQATLDVAGSLPINSRFLYASVHYSCASWNRETRPDLLFDKYCFRVGTVFSWGGRVMRGRVHECRSSSWIVRPGRLWKVNLMQAGDAVRKCEKE